LFKAQIHAGGRGKGSFKNGFKGGVARSRKTPDEVRDVGGEMLGQILVTAPDRPAGRLVNKVLVAESPIFAGNLFCRPARSRDRRAFNCSPARKRRGN